MDSINKEDFCILPWVELQVQGRSVKTCCAQKDLFSDNPQEGLKEIFNNTKAKDLRSQFMKGQVPDACSDCVKHSKAMPTYKVIKHPQWRRYQKEALAVTRVDGETGAPIRFLDLRLGQLCNFACRTCDSFNSSRWAPLDTLLGRPTPTTPIPDIEEEALEGILKILPTVEEIYFAGGEPLLLKSHYRILEWLIEHKHTDIRLSYNTNLSSTAFKGRDIGEYWKHFKTVWVYPSIDSIGNQGEYVRQGFKWEEVAGNLMRLKSNIMSVHAVVSVYNVFSILDLIKWVTQNLKMQTNLTTAYDPSEMSVTVLSPKIKELVEREYSQFMKQPMSESQRNQMKQVVSYMKGRDDSHLASKFKRNNDIMDRYWKKSFSSTFPEMADWYGQIAVLPQEVRTLPEQKAP